MPSRPTKSRLSARRGTMLLGSAFALTLAVTGCAASDVGLGKPASGSASDDPTDASVPTASAAKVAANIAPRQTGVRVDRVYRLNVTDGTFDTVAVTSAHGAPLAGKFSADRSSWNSTAPLQPGATYKVHGVAKDSDGMDSAYDARFSTATLSLNQQTFPSFSPLAGETVGIAMPVVIHFDVPVTNKASIEKHLQVVSSPPQPGAFHWISDSEVHWRPKKYWKAGTDVTVKANIDSVAAGNGIFGQKSRQETFHIGRAMVSTVNIKTDQLQVRRNGKLIRTIPITTGMPGFTTRSGTKVIVEKDRRHDMNSETIGIDPNGPLGYNLKGVEYAMRLTYSGEFLHAAPWSVASQGHSNVSHGCTGMSTSNAAWLFGNSLIGDPVEYTGSDKYMTLTNGYGDWNESFATYAQGSALHS
ncbi:MAG: ErfK/YbiS/YcfS/YnhG family protein [Marmoricola sp.]|nr:ErfK/YbiS/YcfS/YnhG family protein [Marmoricola sp.]